MAWPAQRAIAAFGEDLGKERAAGMQLPVLAWEEGQGAEKLTLHLRARRVVPGTEAPSSQRRGKRSMLAEWVPRGMDLERPEMR